MITNNLPLPILERKFFNTLRTPIYYPMKQCIMMNGENLRIRDKDIFLWLKSSNLLYNLFYHYKYMSDGGLPKFEIISTISLLP